LQGRTVDIIRTFDKKFRVTFEVDAIDDLPIHDGELIITAKKMTHKRSLNANAYFHVLVGKIAEKVSCSKARAKNELLGKYGQREIGETGQIIISVRSDVDMMEREDLHCVPVGRGFVNNTEFTHWAIVRGSHEYNNVEMSALIDGTVEEAKQMGIPTETPDEIERMKALWKANSQTI